MRNKGTSFPLEHQKDLGTKSKLDPITVVGLLSACANKKDLTEGFKLHGYVQEHKFLENFSFVANTLVSMYARCGALAKAQQVLEELPVRNVVTWTALIGGYAQQGQGEEALKFLDIMQSEGLSPDAITFVCALKACGSIGATVKGEEIHENISRLGMLDKYIELGNTLVDMYVRCGALGKAQKVLQGLPVRDVVTWTTLIAGYAQQGQGLEALKCFDSMQQEGHSPNAATFLCLLKACASIRATAKVEQIHDKIVALGLLEKDVMLGNTLVAMYVTCGVLSKAQQALEELPVRDVVTWNALLAGYVQQGQEEQALRCLNSMQQEGHSPNAITFSYALKACGLIGATAKGKEIHSKVVSLGMLEKDIVLGNVLVDMYVKCGALAKAEETLEELVVCSVVTWNVLVAGYAQQGRVEEALRCFDSMQCKGHFPDAVTFTYVLKACGGIGATDKGKQIHDKILSLGLLNNNTILGSALVDMYAKSGALANAQQVLEAFLPTQDVVMWNALIGGYAQQGQGKESLKWFDSMQCQGYSPDVVTFTCVLKAIGSIGAAAKGEEVHSKIVNLGMLEENILLGSSLVDMYARCGALSKAQQVLSKLPLRDVVSWTSLISGCVQQGQGEEALKWFDSMQQDGHSPNAVTFICILKACGSIGAAEKGEQFHDRILGLGIMENNVVLGTALVDMYARCGALHKAQAVLEELPVGDVVSWTALIHGYSQQGQSVESVSCFERMQLKGVKPDSTTLICVLHACSHSGLVNKAKILFSAMRTEYKIIPTLEHYCCMVDLFGRAGKFSKALDVIEEMPSAEYIPLWISLLGACSKWGEVEIGRFAFEHAVQLDQTNATIYVSMAGIYTAAGMQEEADKIEVMRIANQDVKQLNAVAGWVLFEKPIYF